jgi:hypothetical protein
MFFTSIKNKIKSFELAFENLESSVKVNATSLESRISFLENYFQSQIAAEAKAAAEVAKIAADKEAALVAKSATYISGLKEKIEAVKSAFAAEVAHSETVAGTAVTDVKELVSLVTKGI